MTNPPDLSNTSPIQRQRMIDQMNPYELQKAKRMPGAYGASSPQVQRELDQELRSRGPEPGPDDLATGGNQLEDDLGFHSDDDLSLPPDYFIEEPVDQPSGNINQEEQFELGDKLLTCSCNLPDADFLEASKHEDGCIWKRTLKENKGDSNGSSSSESEESESKSSGGGDGAITGTVVGGAVGSVGGPAGMAAGAAIGGVLGALFD